VQGIIGKIVSVNMLPHLIARPGGKRVELDHLVGVIPLNQPGVGAECRLVAAYAGDPGIVAG
jgi:hypothetical protein